MLKKLLSVSTIVCAFIATNSFAQQIPTGDMETWVPQSGYTDPSGWGTANIISSNTYVFGSNSASVLKVGTPDNHGGTYAMKIVTTKYNSGGLVGNLSPYLPNGTLDFAFTGTVMPSAPYLIPGYDEVNRYAQFDFYAKYAPSGTDTATCTITFQKTTGTKNPTIIATGSTQLITAYSSYTKFTINMNYVSSATPDTAIVVFTSSYRKPQLNSALYIDDMAFSGITGINETNMLVNKLNVYPNPATSQITLAATMKDQNLSMVEIFDATGRRIEGVNVTDNKTVLNTNNYAEGFYSYNAYNNKQELIGIGKFIVSK